MTCTEYVLQTTPFVVRRRVKWGECDPAGVAYTVTFSEYVLATAELFYGFLFQDTPQHMKNHHGFGTPTRALAFDFRGSLRPDDEFDMTVTVTDIRSRTYQLTIDGRTAAGGDVFQALLTPICVARPERRSIEMPAVFRQALERYRASCAAVQTPQQN